MRRGRSTRGALMVYAAMLMTAVIGFLALTIDTGRLFSVKSELQNAADSAVLAGASGLTNYAGGAPEARRRARDFSRQNKADDRAIALPTADITIGQWNWDTQVFDTGAAQPNAVQLATSRTQGVNGRVETFFGQLFSPSLKRVDVRSRATGAIEPPNLAFLLDMRNETLETTSTCPPGVPVVCQPAVVCPGHPPYQNCQCTDPDITYEADCPDCLRPWDIKNVATQILTTYADDGEIGVPFAQGAIGSTILSKLTPFTDNLPLVQSAIIMEPSLDAVGIYAAPMTAGLQKAIDVLDTTTPGDKAIIIVYNLDMGGPWDTSGDTWRQVERAKNKRIRLYTVALGKGINPTIDDSGARVDNRDYLKAMANFTSPDSQQRWYQSTFPSLSLWERRQVMRDIADHLPVRLVE